MNKSLAHHSPRRGLARLVPMVLALVLAAAVGCDGGCGDSGSVPDSADARVEQIGQHLPQDTPGALVIGDLADMRTSLTAARDRLGDAVPMVGLVTEPAKSKLGIDMFEAKSWKKAGIAADSALSLSIIGKRPVLLSYIDNKQKFEKSFADQVTKSLGIDGPTTSNTVGDAKVKMMGKDADAVAWAYDGKMVAVAFPQDDKIKDIASTQKAKAADKVVAELVGMDSAKSLAELNGFQRFKSALATDQDITVYVNADQMLSDERVADLKSGADPVSQALVNWADKTIDALGIAVSVEDDAVHLRGWANLPPKVAKTAQAMMTPPATSPVERFATENTMAGARVSVDMKKVWNFYKSNLPDAQRKQMLAALQGRASASKIDVQQDIIDKMTGNLGVVFYGIDKNVVAQNGGNIMRAYQSNPTSLLALIVPIQFQDKASVDKIVAALVKTGGGTVVRAKLEDGVETLKMKNVSDSPGQIYFKDDLLLYATGAFSEQAVYKYIASKRDEPNLAEADNIELGKAFASQKDYNGLYVNFGRIQSQLGDMLSAMIPQANAFLDQVDEAALTTQVGDQGGFVDLTVELADTSAKSGSKKANGAKTNE